MVVFENSLLLLTFDPKSDTLIADWLNRDQYVLAEILQSAEMLVEVMRNYDVKNLLIDASKANFNFANEHYRDLIAYLEKAFRKTHLKRLARVTTTDPLREEKIYSIRQQVNLPYDFRDFKTQDEAMKWLSGT